MQYTLTEILKTNWRKSDMNVKLLTKLIFIKSSFT